MTEPLSRRDFLKLFGIAVPTFIASYNPTAKQIIDILTPSPLPSSAATLLPKNDIVPEPTKGWEIPSIEERIKMLADPKFYLKERGPDQVSIFTRQHDPNEYVRFSNDSISLSAFQGNACAWATFRTIRETFGYFKNGKLSKATLWDTYNLLRDKTYADSYGIVGNIQDTPSSSAVNFAALKPALEILDYDTHLYKVIELKSTPNYGIRNKFILPQSNWKGFFKEAKEKVVDKGGILLLCGGKYGAGHIICGILTTNNPKDPMLIIDSKGPQINGERKGFVEQIILKNYFDPLVDDHKYLGYQPSLIYALGVVPNSE
jgi:hypothetical protein